MARKPSSKAGNSSRKRVEPHFGGELTAPARRKAAKKPSRARKKRGFLRIFFRPLPKLVYWGVIAGLWGLIAVGGILAFYAAQLPSASSWAVPERPPNVRILASDGSLIADRGLTGGKALRLEEMSPHIAQAVIAIEDRRFHLHFGFDPIGFTRAMVRNALKGRLREGGSTITQQLAKNLFLTPERSFGRKVQELILAIWLEAKYTKAQILELYLNRVYFGSGAHGVDAASRRYFGKSARHVTLGEAALLAGLLKAPSRYSPARNAQLAQKRARVVLRAMQEEGYVKQGTVDLASAKPGENARHFRSGPRHFVADFVMRRLETKIGKVTRDIVVRTTIDPYLMTAAQSSLEDALQKSGKKHRVTQGALVSLAPNGAVRAMIGGRDYSASQFNRVSEAKRQPGSAFKTFVWLAAMEKGLSPSDLVDDAPVRFGKWAPQNYDKRYRGPVTLNDAFASSLNTIAAKLTMHVGPKAVARTAKRLGITSPLTANASLALGTSEVRLMDLASAYAPFANGGLRAEPWIIASVETNARHKKAKRLYTHQPALPVEIVDPASLAAMNTMLQAVVRSGTGRAAGLEKHPAGGKTGTSQNFRDALFVGHTAHLVTAVWFGNDDNSSTRKLTGGSMPARVWKDFMAAAHQGLKPKPLPGAANFVSVLPAEVPQPTFRPRPPRSVPQDGVDRGSTAGIDSLRARVQAVVRDRAKRSILDIITGN